jgi:hypothetical protein
MTPSYGYAPPAGRLRREPSVPPAARSANQGVQRVTLTERRYRHCTLMAEA